jgi:hypothetical protein
MTLQPGQLFGEAGGSIVVIGVQPDEQRIGDRDGMPQVYSARHDEGAPRDARLADGLATRRHASVTTLRVLPQSGVGSRPPGPPRPAQRLLPQFLNPYDHAAL